MSKPRLSECGKWTLKGPQINLTFWYSHTRVIPSPYVWMEPFTCFWPTEYIKSDKMSLTWLGYIKVQLYLARSLYYLFNFRALIKQAATLEAHVSRDCRQLLVNRKRVPLSNRLQGTESCQQLRELRRESFPVSLSDETPAWLTLDCNLMRNPETEDPAKPCLDSWPTETLEVINVFFKLLSLWVKLLIVIDN